MAAGKRPGSRPGLNEDATGLPLFDAVAGAAARDEAIARVGEHAPETWMERALAAVHHLAERRPEFTSDPVWHLLRDTGPPPEPRAMGAVFTEAARKGWIVATDRVVPSDRRACHRRPIRVWRSLLHTTERAA